MGNDKANVPAKLPAQAPLPEIVGIVTATKTAKIAKVATDDTTTYLTVTVGEDSGAASYTVAIPNSVLLDKPDSDIRQIIRAVIVAERAAKLRQRANLDALVGVEIDL